MNVYFCGKISDIRHLKIINERYSEQLENSDLENSNLENYDNEVIVMGSKKTMSLRTVLYPKHSNNSLFLIKYSIQELM